MPNVTLDDFEIDFESALDALWNETVADVAKIPEPDREAYFLHGKAEHLAAMLRLRVPKIMVERAEEGLLRGLLARRRLRRQSAGVKST